jgi:3-deoxy-manno-octulosonate cytidylyltransferase (CMP-KDO synthetase)
MTLPRDPIIMIPARMASSRLPNKPLADIHGEPMIVQVWRRAIEADLGRVVVACGEAAIANAIRAAGGEAILTDPDLPSGSDRIHAALGEVDPDGRHDAIINLQGDLPVLEPKVVQATLNLLDRPEVDIGTVAAEITLDEERTSTSVNKAVVAWEQPAELRGRALYFTKAPAPTGGPMFHHIGIYSYRPEALARFVSLPQSPLEKMEKLEQLRALEAGMRIDVARVDTVPLGVDTPADLERARLLLMT